MTGVSWLRTRRLIKVGGAEAAAFLQGLITNDINLAKPTSPLYAFILNAKGRIVHDLLVYSPKPKEFWLDVDRNAAAGLERMLKIYRLRRKVDIASVERMAVGFSTAEVKDALPDPRVPDFGFRLLAPEAEVQQPNEDAYVERRLEWGIAEGPDELADQIPLNANGDILNGINFDKGKPLLLLECSFSRSPGCYVGQELIARTHHTGVVRRRITPFRCAARAEGFIVDANGKKQGRVLKSTDSLGLALIAVDAVGAEMTAGGQKIQTFRPHWWPEEIR
ncbi:putative transferase CAF17, mitochondrial [Aphelenchoides fujianensis]|nr:putative transferase CAF17, mitochondrial [Aphelenchoides fujianensis]